MNSNTDPYKIWVNSGASERLAVPASCTTPAMLLIVIDMYIEYSGFQDMRRIHIIILHNIFKISYTGHNQSKLVPIAGKKFRFIIFIKKKKKKNLSPPHYFCLENPKNKNFFWCGLNILYE